jgi:hypothetical protein
MARKPREITRYAGRVGDAEYGVTTVRGDAPDRWRYRRKPCRQCPWVKGREGRFPPDAYRHSANTSEDMSTHTFACHMSGHNRSADCAGFLLRGALHNLAVRLKIMRQRAQPVVSTGGQELYDNYRQMAVANGVPADDPALANCRDDTRID